MAHFPVEFKDTTQRLNLNAKYQLTAYALMVEECLGQSVPKDLSIESPQGALQLFQFQRHLDADPRRHQTDTVYALRRVDAPTHTTARQMCRVRISSVLCRCVVSVSQIEFLRKR